MSRREVAVVVSAVALVVCSSSIRADVRADEKTKVELGGMLGRIVNIFGGKAAREGVTSIVAVKGNRKATLNDATGQIVDLDQEKVYDLDIKRTTYRVTTFAEIRRRMEEARKKAEEDARKEQAKEPGKEPSSAQAPSEPNVEIDFDVKSTGQTRSINGFDTRESVMTITVREKGKTLEQGGGLVLTADMWLAPRIAAMKDVADFDRRYAEKLYGPMVAGVSAEQMAAALAMYPMLKPAVGRMTTEGAKLEGTPILMTMTMDAVKSADQVAQEAKPQGDDSRVNPAGGVSGVIGGFARRAMKKKIEGDAEAKARATFMTSTNEVLKVTTEVSAGDVAVPAGFKESR